ncbi:MAG: hypothetical protein RL156_1268, partial [Bacteroidota bacterium]
EYLFTGTTSGFGACAAINTFFNFGDGGGWQSGNPATHLYTKNGTYQVSMKVAYPGGDTSYWNTTLTVQSQPTVRVTPQVMYRCSKDSGRIAMASGAVRYEWRPKAGLSDSTVASPRVRPMQNTKYYVRGYDANGCYADDSVQVFVSTITASVSTADTAVCAGASVSLKASGAQTISWFPSSGLNTTKGASVIATPTQTTEYRVIVAEGDCADTGRVLVRVARAPRLQLSPPATVCTGGSTQLSATVFSTDSLDTVGVRFVWKPSATLSNVNVSNPVATPSKTTRYVCTAVNRFGCVRTDSVEVKVQPTLELTLSADTSVCLGSSVMLKAGGGAMYSWSPKDGLNDSTKAAPICTPTKDMTYTVMTWSGDFFTATCRDTAIVHVRVFPFPGIHASGSQTICPQTPVVLRARIDSSSLQGLMPVWYNEDGTVIGTGDSISVQPDSTSLYRVRIRHAQGCESQDSVRVTVSQRLAVRARALSPVVAGSSVILSVEYRQDGAEYTWTKPGGQVVGNGDSCRVTITQRECFIVYGKRGGCDGWDTVCVDIAPDQKVVACEAVRLCRGDSAKLYVLNPQKNTTYSWRAEDNSWNANGDTVVYPALRTGTCYVVATNGLSTSTDSVTVTVFQPPVLSARDTAVCRNTAIVLVVEDTSADDLIEWRDASDRVVSTARTLFLASPSSSSYTIRATSQQGCVSTVSMRLDVNPTVVVSFGLETADTLQPGSMAMINLVAQSNATVTPLHVRAQIGLPSKMISGASGTMLGDTLLITLDTVVSINTSPQVIASLRALCLVSSYEHGVMELRDVAVDTLTSCIEVRKSSRPFVVSHTCGNTLIGIELEPSMINISTGLAGEVLVSCTDQVVVYDIMGRTIAMSDQPPKNGGQSILRLSGLPAGVYAVRSVSNRSALTFVIP